MVSDDAGFDGVKDAERTAVDVYFNF